MKPSEADVQGDRWSTSPARHRVRLCNVDVPAPRRRHRTIALAVIVVVLLGCGLGGIQALVSAGDHKDAPQLSDQAYVSGGCYTWDQSEPHPRAHVVDCARPHLFEAVSTFRLTRRSAAAGYPSDRGWESLEQQTCVPAVAKFLGHALDPSGRYLGLLLHPLSGSWASGDRKVVCGISAQTLPPANRPRPSSLTGFSGRAQGAAQALLLAPGTCLVFPASGEDGTVPCREPHNEIVTGSAVVTAAKRPAVGTYASPDDRACNLAADRFVGHAFLTTPRIAAEGLPIGAASWDAGTRTYTCVIGYFDSSGTPALATGLPH